MNPGAAHFVWAQVASADFQDPSRHNPCPDTRQLRAVCSGVHNGGHPGRRSGAAIRGGHPGRPSGAAIHGPTLAEQLAGKRSLTQVGRALDEAGIAWIDARSAQAKGRVECLWGTFQDRLVSELRLAGITTIEDANAFLPVFLDRHNRRFAVPAADPEPAWRPLPDGLSSDAVFCFHYPRRVSQDSTVSWPGGDLALPRRPDGRSWSRRSVGLGERLDGSLWVEHEGVCVPLAPAPADPGQLRARRLSRPTEDRPELDLGLLAPAPSAERRASRPAADHPWRRRYSGRGR